MKTLAASPLHTRLWLQTQRDPSDSSCCSIFAHHAEGLLDTEALEGAYRDLILRHAILRASWHDHPEGLKIVEHDDRPFAISAQRVDPEEFEEVQDAFMARLASEPFDLAQGPLLRVGVLKSGPERALIVTVAHRLALDEDSAPAFFAQLGERYRALRTSGELPDGPASPLPSAPSELSHDDAHERWRSRLRGTPLRLPLPTLVTGLSAREVTHTRALSGSMVQALSTKAEASGARVAELLAAYWAALLHRFTGAPRVAFLSPMKLYGDAHLGKLGALRSLVPMVFEVEGASSDDLISQALEGVRLAQSHPPPPFEELLALVREEVGLAGDAPYLNVAFGEAPLRPVSLALEGLSVEPSATPPPHSALELGLWVDLEEGVTLRLSGRGDRFPQWHLAALLESFLTLCEAANEAPKAPIDDLALVNDAQRLRLRAHSEGRDLEVKGSGTLAEHFHRVASASPDAVAVQTGIEGMTYWALDVRSNRTAHALIARLGAPPEHGARVGVLFDPSAESVVAMLALVKLGLTILPLRTRDPLARWRAQLEAAGAIALMGHGRYLEQLPDDLGVVTFSPDSPGSLSGQPDGPVSHQATEASAAALLFTSSDEGELARVSLSHRALIALALGGGAHAISAEDSVAHGANLAGALALWEIWSALLVGARLVVLTEVEMRDAERLAHALEAHQVSALALPSTLFHSHADVRPTTFQGLRLLMLLGDDLSSGALERVISACERGPERIVKGFGPLENTLLSTLSRLGNEPSGAHLPLGRPRAGTRCYVADPRGRLVPIGFPGELFLGGVGLATAQASARAQGGAGFVSAPASFGVGDLPLFRSGERVRWRQDGQLERFGRLEDAATRSGYRLEAREVSAKAMTHPEVRQAVSLVVGGPSPELLLAYTLDPHSRLSDRELFDYLSERLPLPLVPTRRVRVAALPLDDACELDVEALVAIAPGPTEREEGIAAPQGEREQTLSAIFSELLERDEVGVNQRFFDLGGDSLRAYRLSLEIEARLGAQVTLKDIYRLPTPRALASLIAGEASEPAQPRERLATRAEELPKRLPLTPTQRGHLERLRRGFCHTRTLVLHLQTRIDPEALLEAWGDVLARHEVPWMHLDIEQGEMRRVDSRMAAVVRMDLTRLEERAAEYQVLSRVRRSVEESFQNQTPSISAILAQAGHASWYFALMGPHALIDLWSLHGLSRELHDTYLARLDGRSSRTHPPPALADYVLREEERLSAFDAQEALTYYAETLAGDAGYRVPASHLMERLSRHHVQISPEVHARVTALADALSLSLEATLTSALCLTLHALHRAPLIRLNVRHHAREQGPFEALPMTRSRTYPLMSRSREGESFREALVRQAEHHARSRASARLPEVVSAAMAKQLARRGRVGAYMLSRVLGSVVALFSREDALVKTSRIDLALHGVLERLFPWLGAKGERGRAEGRDYLIAFDVPPSAPALLGSARLPMSALCYPEGVPEGDDGRALVAFYPGDEGLRVLFQASYPEHSLVALAEAFLTLLERLTASPDAPALEAAALIAPLVERFESPSGGGPEGEG